LIAPFIIHYSEKIVIRFVASEWLMRSMQLTQIAARSMSTEKHAILCGYARNGQFLARFLTQEGVNYIALDLDPRPRAMRLQAGGRKCGLRRRLGRKEALIAAGLMRASVVIVTFSDTQLAERVLHHVAGAATGSAGRRAHRSTSATWNACRVPARPKWCRRSLEASLMLASHALVLVGVPINRVLKRIRQARSAAL
jgi:CPA2 family monovalent cation:H+ antiporter-2